MYKVLIVDDEQIVIDSMTHILEANFKDKIKLITAKSGITAIEKAIEFRPEIVFMDINIPGIKGLEVIKEIQNFENNIDFYIISAYEQFDFAKEAIKLGVTDYILKPLTKNKLLETTEKALKKLENNKTKRIETLKLKEKAELLSPIIENNFIYNIMFKKDFIFERQNYLNLLNFDSKQGYILILSFSNTNNLFGFKDKIIKIHLSLKNKINSKKCIYGPVIDNKIILFVSEIKKETEYFDKSIAVKFSNTLAENIRKITDISFKIGIGLNKYIKNLTSSYEEATKAILFGKNDINYYLDINLSNFEDINLNQYANEFINKISLKQSNEKKLYFEEAFEFLNKKSFNNTNMLKTLLIKLLINIENILRKNQNEEFTGLINSNDIDEIFSMNNDKNLKSFFFNKCFLITKLYSNNLEKNYSNYTKQTISYLKKKYRKEISLEQISSLLYISPQYLSKLFKDETGKNFIDFLIELRMSNAKKLLKNTDKTIKEIAYEIGYNDPNYFSRIFKKEIKLSPKEFRKTIKEKE